MSSRVEPLFPLQAILRYNKNEMKKGFDPDGKSQHLAIEEVHQYTVYFSINLLLARLAILNNSILRVCTGRN